ncbi:MAG: hypothetical protein A9Z00_09075 [Thermobacillus sp. ZCTH02-B1]|uniref:hypothetical protein n=1 Tax=Thermobacillus sp. ZCTH02-B1 TaxID=1858795 RepID=UPI000B57F770|nr:hypothetical protein [Thermobacillus sp. ZCTH02-B1]OUM94841.1 MAG: hypothetical protein A9Z00_09075 [Thermobacillus sp. ZCTH02-B1]
MDDREERREGGRAARGPEADAERLLAERLGDGPVDEPDREELVRLNLPPKYEVRIQTEYDPIVEETKRYRSMAREIDGRYDRFMIRLDEGGKDKNGDSGKGRDEER